MRGNRNRRVGMKKEELYRLLENGPVYLDGAPGSNLQKAGMPTGVCPEQWILDHPDVILDLQKRYIEAGTQILYAPTFSGNRIKLEEYGLADKIVEINTKLVQLCREAAGEKGLVCGDMTMTGESLEPMGDLELEELIDIYKEQAKILYEAGVDAIVIDTAHGHQINVPNMLKRVKAKYPDLDVVVGNIATAEAAKMLAEAGADGVKVGIGPGSICTTRIIAGIGMPQLTAIYDVAKALKGTGIPVIADGGLRYSGDIVKALAAGADSVMAGSMFAGVEESPGETIIYNGRKFKAYRGMGSLEAMQHGSKDRYFQDMESDIKKLVPEGIAARVPYKGSLKEVIYQLIGGLRAGMGYCGAKDIAALKNARFVRITHSGMLESHPHDVTITREAPNYTRGE